MDNEDKLSKGVGNLETERLKAGIVKIKDVEIEYVEKAKSDKVVFIVEHSDAENSLKISSAKILTGANKEELKTVGLWYNLDKEDNIQKGSAVANVLQFLNATNLNYTKGKDIELVEGKDGYLTIKAYS